MGYATSRFAEAAAPHLDPGERIVGGTWARTPDGSATERACGHTAAIAAHFDARTLVAGFVTGVDEQLVTPRCPS